MSFKQLVTLFIFAIGINFELCAEQELKIIYTNDIEGSVATCGCAVDPGGGVIRRVNWYQQNNFSPTDTIYVNSGSTFFSGSDFMNYETEYLKLGASIMADALIAMNIDAYTPGAYDLKMGKDFFESTTKKLPVLITNTKEKGFLKEIKTSRAGLNIKIFGVVTDIKGFPTIDAVKTLKPLTSKKNKKDYFILLADTKMQDLEKILKSIKNIDVVVSSSIEEQLTKPLMIGKTTILRLLKGGDSIGLFTKENQVIFLGRSYNKDNNFTDRIKKYEGLQNTTAPKVKADF